eukprot:comp22541_c0_seq19/m.57189 comp22541_c0_seq19/g.57189  ORF comp22541_c0_seq19/g.57189 comp22541_c0_seq19/m.57189 type:complete len:125 (-) comp22541_c0_seq19:67-441(-)
MGTGARTTCQAEAAGFCESRTGTMNSVNSVCKSGGVCGNSKIDALEECDDGNNVAGDGCNSQLIGIQLEFTCDSKLRFAPLSLCASWSDLRSQDISIFHSAICTLRATTPYRLQNLMQLRNMLD